MRAQFAVAGSLLLACAQHPPSELQVPEQPLDVCRDDNREAILSRFPGAQLKVIAGCGHWLHAEKPEMFNRLVSRFLDTSTG